MTIPGLSKEDLLVQVTGLGTGLARLKRIRAKYLQTRGGSPSLSPKKRAAYGGWLHCIGIIECGNRQFRRAFKDRKAACAAAMLMRPLIEWYAKSHWLLREKDAEAISEFLSGANIKPGTPHYRTLGALVDMCRTYEKSEAGNPRFLGDYGAQLDKLHKFVHGGHREMSSGASESALSDEFSAEVVSDMILVFGGVMFMAYQGIAEIEGAKDLLGRIRRHRNAFYELFPRVPRQRIGITADPTRQRQEWEEVASVTRFEVFGGYKSRADAQQAEAKLATETGSSFVPSGDYSPDATWCVYRIEYT